jgi:hypothetical protein
MLPCPHCNRSTVALRLAAPKRWRIACRACGRNATIGWLCLALASLPLLVAACASLLAPNAGSAALCWLVGTASTSALIYGFAPLVKR